MPLTAQGIRAVAWQGRGAVIDSIFQHYGQLKTKGEPMKKLDLIIIAAVSIIGLYYMTALADAYYRAMTVYFDVKNSQIAQIMGGGK